MLLQSSRKLIFIHRRSPLDLMLLCDLVEFLFGFAIQLCAGVFLFVRHLSFTSFRLFEIPAAFSLIFLRSPSAGANARRSIAPGRSWRTLPHPSCVATPG